MTLQEQVEKLERDYADIRHDLIETKAMLDAVEEWRQIAHKHIVLLYDGQVKS